MLIGVAFFSYVQAKSAQTYYLSVQDKNLGDNKKDAFPQEYKNEAASIQHGSVLRRGLENSRTFLTI